MKTSTQSRSALRATAMLASALAVCAVSAAPMPAAPQGPVPAWIASWQAGRQPVSVPDFMFPTNVSTELSDQTVHQLARISLGGARLRQGLPLNESDASRFFGGVAASYTDYPVVTVGEKS